MSLQVQRLSKRFGGLAAVDEVSFDALSGAVTAVIGPNGAGKTTVLNLVSGVFASDGGSVFLDGVEISLQPAWQRARHGLARTFQTPQLFEGMTVLETVMIGAHMQAKAGLLSVLARLPKVRKEEESLRLRAEEALDYIGISPTQWQRIALELPYGLQRKVEIARAVAMQATTFLLDEPAAGLNGSETSALSDLFLKLRADGKCVILIEHNMEMVMRISDHVVVMNFGQKIAEGGPREVQANAAVVEAYLGVEEEEC